MHLPGQYVAYYICLVYMCILPHLYCREVESLLTWLESCHLDTKRDTDFHLSVHNFRFTSTYRNCIIVHNSEQQASQHHMKESSIQHVPAIYLYFAKVKKV